MENNDKTISNANYNDFEPTLDNSNMLQDNLNDKEDNEMTVGNLKNEEFSSFNNSNKNIEKNNSYDENKNKM